MTEHSPSATDEDTATPAPNPVTAPLPTASAPPLEAAEPDRAEVPDQDNGAPVPAGQPEAADAQPAPGEPPVQPLPARAVTAFPPLSDVTRIGDAGRQEEVVPVHGPLSIGVSDTELDFFTADPFEVRACATRGASHRHAGTPRQDAFCVAQDDKWLAVCVADGVSEGRHSQVAAETAARAACKLALDGAGDLESLDWTALANRVSRRILDEARYRRLVDLSTTDDPAEQIRVVRRAMSTTAVVALVARRPGPDGGFPYVVAVLAGDSGAYILRNGRFAVVAGGKDPGASGVADGAVHPLPGPSSPGVVRSALDPDEVLLLTSDGVGDPIGDGTGEVGTELARRWQEPPTAVQLFADVNFLRRSYDDDRTVVGVWVLPEEDAR
ncbi:protein phosphatase 2C domain-containing protein [Blastococcus sp. SYSU DS0617]